MPTLRSIGLEIDVCIPDAMGRDMMLILAPNSRPFNVTSKTNFDDTSIFLYGTRTYVMVPRNGHISHRFLDMETEYFGGRCT